MKSADRTPKPNQISASDSALNRKTIPPKPTRQSNTETVLPSQLDSVPGANELRSDLVREFGRYQILECLGQGAMGEVYKARDQQLDRTVALKIPKFSGEAEPALLERFYREARSAATLNHPNICPVYDVGEYEGTHYISMGFIDGNALSAFIKPNKPQPERKVVSVVRKLAAALEEAHRQGIIHRDLKPDNVMIDKRGQPIVMDFGLAQQTNTSGDIRTTQGGQMIGTPAYMSPEQVDGDLERIGPASDVYSLGVILYEFLTGELPFQGSVASVLAQIIQGKPTPPSQRRTGLDSMLESICLKMMAANREERYQTMAQVTQALTAWMKGESSTVPKTQSSLPTGADAEAVFDFVDTGTQLPRKTRFPPKSSRTSGTRRKKKPARRSKRKPLSRHPGLLLAGVGAVAVLLLLGIVLFVRVGDQTVKIEIDDPDAQVFIDGDKVTIKNLGATVELKPGEHNLDVRRGDVVVQTDKFQVFKGDNPVLKIEVEKPKEDKPMIAQNAPTQPNTATDPPSSEDQKPKPPKTSPMPSEPVAQSDSQTTPKTGDEPETKAARFIERGPYVEDTKTGLLWQKDGDVSGKLNFYQAADYAKSLKLGGLTDWRVPTIEELATIFPATDLPFTDTKYTEDKCCEGPYEWNNYWTSFIRAANIAYVYQWYADGGANSGSANNFAFVRCVHDPTNPKYQLANPSHQLVEWVVKRGGHLSIRVPPNKSQTSIRRTSEIPATSFEILSISLPSGTKVPQNFVELVGQQKTLLTLRLESSGLSDAGLRLIAQNRALSELWLNGNPLTDGGLRHLSGLTSLKQLWLESVPVTNTGLKHLAGLTGMENLCLEGAKIDDQGIDVLVHMKNLRMLDMDHTQFTDTAVERIKDLPYLEYLYLRNTKITDQALESLSSHKTLKLLLVDQTEITDKGLASLSRMSQLETLHLNGCNVTDKGVSAHLTKLKKLRSLGLSETKLTDGGLEALSRQLPKISYLTTDNTAVTPEGFAMFRKAHPRPGPPRRPRRPDPRNSRRR